MNMRFCRTFAVVAGMACAVSSVFAAEAETIVVTTENSPYYIGGTGGDAKNNASRVYDLQPGATLCISNLSNIWRIWTNVISTNGLAYITSLEEKPSELNLRGTLIASGDGRIGLKRFNLLTVDVDVSTGAYLGDACCDVKNLFFADEDGNERTGSLTIFKGTVKSLPKSSNVKLTWAEGAQIALVADNPWRNDDPFVFPSDNKMSVYLAEPGAVKAGTTVEVPAGCTFGMCAAEQSGANNPFTYGYRTTGVAFSNDNNVVLAAGATFACASRVTDVCTGRISGEGEVSIHSFKDRDGSTWVTSKLLGENTYSGATRILNNYQRLYFGSSVPAGVLAATGLWTECRFLPAEAPEGGNAQVTVNAFDGQYLANKIVAASNQTVTVKRITGKGWGEVDVEDGSAIVDFNPAVGPAVIRGQSQFGFLRFNGQLYGQAGVVQLFKDDGNELLILLPGPNGEGTPWTEGSGLRVNRPWLTVAGDQKFTTLPAYAPIRVMGESTVTISTEETKIGTIVGPQATAKVEYSGDWKKTAALWLDPDTSKLYYQGELALQEWKDKVIDSGGSLPSFTKNGGAGPYIEGLMDCRGEETHGEYMAFNDRDYDGVGGNPPKMENIGYMTHAQLATRSDGLKYIDCHSISGARLPLHKGGKDTIKINNEPAFAATMAIFVINSENGGGAAVIGTEKASYARTKSATGPITSNAVVGDIWLDGKKVADPTVTCLNGGWQILSIDVSKYPINGFGWDKRRSNNGGADYGDIILFTNKVTAVERQAVEKYLANKWRITTYEPETQETIDIQVSGSGTAELSSGTPLTVGGGFCGTAKLAAGTEIIIPTALPWGEAEIAGSAPTGWYDPSDRSLILTKEDCGMGTSQADEICALWDKRGGYKTKNGGRHYLYGINERAPTYVEYQRGTGPSFGWIDYNNLYEASLRPESTGNTFRMRYWDASYTDKTALGEGGDKAFDAKTIFIVQDSCRGGSTPVHDTVSGGSAIPRRSNDANQPIFSSSTVAGVKGGVVRLNGRTVATPTSTGFTGEPEVFSFSTANEGTFPAGFFACYQETESNDPDVEKRVEWIRAHQAGAIQGEIIVYDKYLSDEDRKHVEDYLMGKWLGYLPSGYADWRKATVDGAGTVKAATLGIAPKLASTFAGTLALTESEAAPTYEATITSDGVTGGLVATEATVTHNWSGNPKLNVTVSGQKVYGEFTLVSLKAISPTVTWDVVVTSKKGLAEVVQSDGGATVKVKIVPRGTMILIR